MLTFYLNPSSYLRIHRQGLVLPDNSDIYVDSVVLSRILQALGVRIMRRCFDLSFDVGHAVPLFQSCSRNAKLLFVGGTEEDAARFVEIISERFELKDRLVAISGYSDELAPKIDCAIKRYNPTHLVLGLGAPLQEKMALHFNSIYPSIDIRTCGGFITQTAMKGGDFYPSWIQWLGMRWLYRFFKQPKVIFRVLFEYPYGIYLFARSDIARRFRVVDL